MRRRELRIDVAFAPMRLSSAHLRTAYQIVVPVIERSAVQQASVGEGVGGAQRVHVRRDKQRHISTRRKQ
jgi:hypothetical protein